MGTGGVHIAGRGTRRQWHREIGQREVTGTKIWKDVTPLWKCCSDRKTFKILENAVVRMRLCVGLGRKECDCPMCVLINGLQRPRVSCGREGTVTRECVKAAAGGGCSVEASCCCSSAKCN